TNTWQPRCIAAKAWNSQKTTCKNDTGENKLSKSRKRRLAGCGPAEYAITSSCLQNGASSSKQPTTTHDNTKRSNHVHPPHPAKIPHPTSRQNRQPLLVLEMPTTRTTTIHRQLGNRLPSSHPPRTQPPQEPMMTTKANHDATQPCGPCCRTERNHDE